MDLKELDSIKINFIVGPGRSGTTLLVYLFNQSDRCVAAPEIKHLMFFYKKYRNVTVVTKELISDYKKYVALFKENKKFLLSAADTVTWLDELKIGQEINYSRLSKLVYFCLMDNKTDFSAIDCIIDKNPYYTFYIDELLEIFPDSKFVVMIRDHRAYILSNRQSQKPFVRVLSVFYYAAVWNLHAKKIITAVKKYGSTVKVVKYEDMAEKKEEVIEKISVHLDVRYSTELFDFYKSVTERMLAKNISIDQYERAAKRLRDLSSPINMDRVNSWKKQLSVEQISEADFICAKFAPALGYPVISNTGISKRILYFLASFPGVMRIKIFTMLDSPRLNYFINLIQIKKKKRYTAS